MDWYLSKTIITATLARVRQPLHNQHRNINAIYDHSLEILNTFLAFTSSENVVAEYWSNIPDFLTHSMMRKIAETNAIECFPEITRF